MGDKSKIQWTEATWNPVRGCTKVSAGCKNCYAEAFAERFRGVEGHAYEQGFDLRLVPESLENPLRWTKPRMVFVNSMSDLFHEGVSDEYIAAVFGVMAAAKQHTFQILTKRPERARQWFEKKLDVQEPAVRYLRGAGFNTGCGSAFAPDVWPLPNVWLGVSVEDQATAYERIPELMMTPAAVRFLSCEPLLGPLLLWKLTRGWLEPGRLPEREVYPLQGLMAIPDCDWDVGRIGWVIVGGESGGRARPMRVEWAREIVTQCRDAKVPVFVKQMGTQWAREQDGFPDPKGGEPEEWPKELRVRQMPEVSR